METLSVYRIRIGLFSASVKASRSTRKTQKHRGEECRLYSEISRNFTGDDGDQRRKSIARTIMLIFFCIYCVNQFSHCTYNLELNEIQFHRFPRNSLLPEGTKYVYNTGSGFNIGLELTRIFHFVIKTRVIKCKCLRRKMVQVTENLTEVKWNCVTSCQYLLGNKGCYVYYGNPGREPNPDDPGEAWLSKETLTMIKERMDESVGFITIRRLLVTNTDHYVDSMGTGFRVGDRYLMTAYHVFKEKIDDLKELITFHLDSTCSVNVLQDLIARLGAEVNKSSEVTTTTLEKTIGEFLNKTGTNIPLLLQRIDKAVDNTEDSECLSLELTEKWTKNCVVDFIKHRRFYVDWKIPFGDSESDVVIVSLRKIKNDQILPKPMYLDENYNNDSHNIHIIRYIHASPPKVIIDQAAQLFQTDSDLRKEVTAAIEWWKIHFPEKGEDFFRNQYGNCRKAFDEDTGRVILRASKSFISGSSGSPILYMSKSSDRPVVGVIYQQGYPAFYYNAKGLVTGQSGQNKQITVDCKCFFESGTAMNKVAELLRTYDLMDLKNNVFSQILVPDNLQLVPRPGGTIDRRVEHIARIFAKETKSPSEIMNLIVSSWKDVDRLCYVTTGVQAVKERISSNACSYLTVTGVPGSGKSTAIRYSAIYLKEHAEYLIYPVTALVEFEKYFDKTMKQLFIFDDPFGEYGIDRSKLNEWRICNDRIKICLQASRNTKLLIAIRIQLFQEDAVTENHYIFRDSSRCINLGSNDYKLDKSAMQKMLRHCLQVKGVDEKEKIISNISWLHAETFTSYFPLLCKVFCEEGYFSGNDPASFFIDPLPALTHIFSEMKSGNKHQYCGLLLCSAFDGDLKDNILSPVSEFHGDITKDTIGLRDAILAECNLRNEDLQNIKSGLQALDGVFVNRLGNSFRFTHSIFQNIVTYLNNDPSFVFTYGTNEFIRNRVRFDQAFETDDQYMLIFDAEQEMNRLSKRLVKDLKNHPDSASEFIVSTHYIDDKRLIKNLKTELFPRKNKSQKVNKKTINKLFEKCMEVVYRMVSFYKETNTGDVSGPCYQLITMLIEKGVDCNTAIIDDVGRKVYPIHLCTWIGSLDLVTLLLRQGADVRKLGTHGRSVLHYACEADLNRIKLVKLLIKHGCSLKHLTESKHTVLHKLSMLRKGDDCLELAKYFIKRGCSVNCQDVSGQSVLHNIAMYNEGTNRVQLAKLFLEHGCSVNLLTNSHESILHYVAQYSEGESKLELAELFVEHGCDVNVTENKFNRNVLHFAVRGNENLILTRFLLSRQDLTCMNGVDKYNRTPYWYVVNNILPVWFGGGSRDYVVPNRQEMIDLYREHCAKC